jgi:hypothetical protein
VKRAHVAILSAAAACVCLAAPGCRSADDKAREERSSASSWCATLRESALDLRSRRIPARFARDTFRQAREELSDELSRLRKLSAHSTAAADAAPAVAEAAGIASALESDPAADVDGRAARLGALAAQLSRGAGS